MNESPHRQESSLPIAIATLVLSATMVDAARADTSTWLQKVMQDGYTKVGYSETAVRGASMLEPYLCQWNRKNARDSKARAMDETCSMPPASGTEIDLPDLNVLRRMVSADIGAPLDLSTTEKAQFAFENWKDYERTCFAVFLKARPDFPLPLLVSAVKGVTEGSTGQSAINACNNYVVLDGFATGFQPSVAFSITLKENGKPGELTRHLN